MIITGLRGVGKTVLLSAFEEAADARRWVTIDAEITKNTPFGPRMANLARKTLFGIAPAPAGVNGHGGPPPSSSRSASASRPKDRSQRDWTSIRLKGSPIPGNSIRTSPNFSSLSAKPPGNDTGVVFLFDEVQFLASAELEALIAALHKVVQRRLPVTLVGAGLPQIPRLAGEAKSYAERLFKFPHIGSLPTGNATRALTQPAADHGVQFTPAAVDAIVTYTEGYPYFLQEYGKPVWDEATSSPIDLGLVTQCQVLVEAKTRLRLLPGPCSTHNGSRAPVPAGDGRTRT